MSSLHEVYSWSTPEEAIHNLKLLMQGWKREQDGKGQPAIAVFDIDDTIIMDGTHASYHNQPIVELYHTLKSMGFIIGIVTARAEDPQARAYTAQQLWIMGFRDYDHLYLCPDSCRGSSTEIAKFKRNARRHISQKYGNVPIGLTVGDQWTDIHPIDTDTEMFSLDQRHPDPCALVRAKDGICVWGLKLPANY